MDYATALQKVGANPDGPVREVALLSNWQASVLETFLVAHGVDRGCRLKVHANPFGSLEMSLERLRDASPAPQGVPLVVLMDEEILLPGYSLRSDALPTRESVDQSLAEAPKRLRHFSEIAAHAARNRPLFLVPSPLPPFPLLSLPPFAESRLLELRHRTGIELAELQARFPLQIRVLDPVRIWGSLPFSGILDDRLLFTGGWPLNLKATDLLARAIVESLLQPVESRKLLVTDADQTLWQGIVGDEGVDAISWAQEADTYRFFLYQKTLNFLMSEGVLVAIASKNDPESLEGALARADLVLARDRLVTRRASWGSKSAMMAEILAETNLLPSSVVFVDDSLFEIGEVQSSFPEVRCLRFPDGNAGLRPFLEELRGCFDTRFVSEEDRQRSRTTRLAADFKRQSGSASSLEDYLRGLDMRAAMEPVSPANSERAFQLINKTNQFNLSGRRFSAQEWQELLAGGGARAWQLAFRDQHGQYGTVSVLIADRDGNVTDWVLSCRVFGRTIEHYMVNFLLERLAANGGRSLKLHFKETPKNHATAVFLKENAAPGGDGGVWTVDAGRPLRTFVAPL